MELTNYCKVQVSKRLFHINGFGEKQAEISRMALVIPTTTGMILALPYTIFGSGMRNILLYSAEGQFIKVLARYSGTIKECREVVNLLAKSSLV